MASKQFFTRAVDTGFSKSAEETMKAWGDLPVEDMVRVIRTFRPDVVINGWGGVHFGHGQHQASGIYTPEAVADAADPTKFPEQIAEGLKPWKVGLELRPAGFGFGPASPPAPKDAVTLPINDVSPLWGKSYVEMGMEGHAQHRSQGTPSFSGNPFFRRPTSLITEHGQEAGGGFDPKLLAQPITSLAARYPSFQAEMAPALASADQDLAAAAKQALELNRAAASDSLAQAGKEIAALREKIASAGGDESAPALWELDQVRDRIDAALVKDIALPIDTQADRHELVAGESFGVTVSFLDQSAAPVKWSVDQSSLAVPKGWSVTLAPSKAREDLPVQRGRASGRYTADIARGRNPAIPTPAGHAGAGRRRRRLRFQDSPDGRIRGREHHRNRHLSARTDSRRHADRRAEAADGPGETRVRGRGAARARALPRNKTCHGLRSDSTPRMDGM